MAPAVDADAGLGLPFSRREYDSRLRRTLALMSAREVDTLIVTDPANMVWLSGYDANSFYVPQALIVSPELPEPLWVGRGLDKRNARETSWLSPESLVTYGDDRVQLAGRNAGGFIGEVARERGLTRGRVGLELDSYYFTPRFRDSLVAAMPDAEFVDLGIAGLRCVKSAEELEVMRQAALIASRAMEVALAHMRVGARECDVAAEIVKAQVAGTPEYGGFPTSDPPYLLRGRRGAAPHVTWGRGRFQPDETAYVELLGCRFRYQVTVSRAVHFGAPPPYVTNVAEASGEAILAALETARPGRTCADVANAMLRIFERRGIEKSTRCGYAAGIGYPPTSGEGTMSLHPEDHTALVEGMTFHVHPNMLFDDWGLYITESMVVTERGGQPFTQLPRALVVRA
jgi:ectoine hydrolase